MSSTLGLTWRLIRREIGTHRLRSLLTMLLVAAPVAFATHSAMTLMGTAYRPADPADVKPWETVALAFAWEDWWWKAGMTLPVLVLLGSW